MRSLTSCFLVACLAACGGGKRDMEKVCDAEARSGAKVDVDRAKVLAWIESNASGDPRQAARDAFAKPAAESAAPLRAAAAKYGVVTCSLADALAYEPPPPPPPVPRALPRNLEPIPSGGGSPLGRLAPPTGTQNVAKVEASGGITQEAATATIDLSKIGTRLCYERARKKNPHLSGRVKLELTLGATGAVASTKDAGSTIDPEVASCVLGILSKALFQAPTGAATVIVTYDFVPED